MSKNLQELNKLNISAGHAMNIEIGGGQRYHTKLLGLYPGKSILIATPMLSDERPLLIRTDQIVIVRFFAQKMACAFKAKVRHLCTTPYHYMHLYYPGRVEVGEVRKATRAHANVRVSIVNKTNSSYKKTSGSIIDISTVGAKLETVTPVAQAGDILILTAMVQIGRIKRLVTWDAEVKLELDKLELDNAQASYGIEFHYLNDLDYLALHGYVNGQLARGVEI